MLITNLQYLSYSTGLYDGGKYDGVTLQLKHKGNAEIYHVIFNANIRRKRTIKNNKAGSLLPKGRFSVGRRSAFYKFWLSTDLPLPPRLSAFNDYMGNLKQFTFSAQITKGTRLDARSLRPKFDFPNNAQTIPKQSPNKAQTKSPNNDELDSHINTVYERHLTACENNYETSKQVDTNTSKPDIPLDETKRVQMQTHGQWLADFSAECDALF